MKYLIVGLGNIGSEYHQTRHNIGFDILDHWSVELDSKFTSQRYAWKAEAKYRSHKLILIKPSTYMNLSGNAIRYWLAKEKISLENLIVLVDDIALPLGSLRLRKQGGAGGHNGLENINQILQTSKYNRLRFGIGSEYSKGRQVEFVLSKWEENEKDLVADNILNSIEIIKSIIHIGIDRSMNKFNKAGEGKKPKVKEKKDVIPKPLNDASHS